MPSIAVEFQAEQASRAKTVLRQHSPDSFVQDAVGVPVSHLSRGGPAQTARIQGVLVVNLLGPLFAGQSDFIDIGDDHEVAAVNVARKFRLVFAGEHAGNFRCEATQSVTSGVDFVPGSLDLFGSQMCRFHKGSLRLRLGTSTISDALDKGTAPNRGAKLGYDNTGRSACQHVFHMRAMPSLSRPELTPWPRLGAGPCWVDTRLSPNRTSRRSGSGSFRVSEAARSGPS